MSLATPEAIRSLQRNLYLKAKAEPDFRFYLLYDKIHRADILRHAYALARSNGGAPGVDGVSFAMIEAAGLEEWLARLQEGLVRKTDRAEPVRLPTGESRAFLEDGDEITFRAYAQREGLPRIGFGIRPDRVHVTGVSARADFFIDTGIR